MNLISRPWSGEHDLVAMQALLSRSWLTHRPLVAGTPGDLEWWIAQDPGWDGTRDARLWWDGETLAGWAYFQPPSEIEWHVAAGLPAGPIHEAMLDWLEQRTAEGQAARSAVAEGQATGSAGSATETRPVERTTIWAMETETDVVDLFQRRGFEPTDAVLSHWIRSASEPIGRPELPPGYRLRTVRWPEDLEARIDVHRAAFHPSRMVMERYLRLAERPHYSPHRDWVIEAPNGTFAAFTIGWLDPLGRVGELEPVGTHPDHRRRGLGRAVCLAAIAQLVELGADDVLIFSEASNTAAEALYGSTGARVATRSRRFARPTHLQSGA